MSADPIATRVAQSLRRGERTPPFTEVCPVCDRTWHGLPTSLCPSQFADEAEIEDFRRRRHSAITSADPGTGWWEMLRGIWPWSG